MIAIGMGTGLVRRLENRGIKPVITTETNPEQAVEDYLNGTLHIKYAEPHVYGHRHGQK